MDEALTAIVQLLSASKDLLPLGLVVVFLLGHLRGLQSP